MSSQDSALFVPPNSRETVSLWADRMTFNVTGEETGGAYAILEYVAAPGSGSPFHVHRNEDESFYILAGTMTFQLGESKFEAVPGSFVRIPRGLVHAFVNQGVEHVRSLVILSPAGLERFFKELGELAGNYPEGAPREAFLTLARKYNLDFEVPAPGTGGREGLIQ
jgi:quercetin dioxygenase-like cupin family protein